MNDKVQPILLGNPNHRQNNVGYIQVHGTDSSSSRSSSPDSRISWHQNLSERIICILDLPAYLIPGRLISFFKPSLDAVESISVFASKDRNEKYTTIIIAKSENGANQLFEDFNGVRFSSFDQSCCFMHRVERFGVSANSWDDSNAQQFINLFTSCGENSDSLKVFRSYLFSGATFDSILYQQDSYQSEYQLCSRRL